MRMIDAEIKCPCGLRDYMEEEDCKKTDCKDCCPLQKEIEGDDINNADQT